jgi:hypothetical protein
MRKSAIVLVMLGVTASAGCADRHRSMRPEPPQGRGSVMGEGSEGSRSPTMNPGRPDPDAATGSDTMNPPRR